MLYFPLKANLIEFKYSSKFMQLSKISLESSQLLNKFSDASLSRTNIQPTLKPTISTFLYNFCYILSNLLMRELMATPI